MGVVTTERQKAVASELQRIVRQTDFTAYDYFSIKQALVQFLRINYPNDFNDYIESSAMMAYIENLAYVGELLAFRIDMNINEGKLAFVTNRDNALNLVRPYGYQSTRQGSASGTVKLVTELDSGGLPVDDATYIAGLPRWIFSPAITTSFAATAASLTPNIPYLTIIENHVAFDVLTGSETLPFELESSGYSSGVVADPIDTNFLSLVFDGTNFVCITQQGQTITESFIQTITQTNLIYETSQGGADTTIPFVKVAGNKWKYDTSLYLPNPTTLDKFSTIHDATDRLAILFGDGIGASLPLGNIDVIYRITDGLKGNVNSTDIADIVVTKVLQNSLKGNALETFDLHITATTSFVGGSVSESLSSIKLHAPSTNRTQNRQVTGSDYLVTALSVAGVTAAQSIARTQVGHDATGAYSSAAFIGTDATAGTVNQFTTATRFAGAIPGIDTVHRIDVGESTTRFAITDVVTDPTGASNDVVTTTADLPLISGTADGSSGTLALIESTATFITSGITVGRGVFNITDGSTGSIVSVDSETQVTTTLTGGTANVFALNDAYELSQWPTPWTGTYQWDHWAANLNGATYFISTTTTAGQATFDGLLSSHFVDGTKILLIDHYTGNWFTSSTTNLTFTLPPSPSVAIDFTDGNGTLATSFTPRGKMTLIIDYTYQSQVSGLTVSSSPAPDANGDFIFQPATQNANVGDILWNTANGYGYSILDIIRNSQVVAAVSYDKLYLSRNKQTGGILAGSETLVRSSFAKKVTVLENPSKINIIDIYILTTDANGYPESQPSNTTLLASTEAAFTTSSIETDNVFAHWGSVKNLPIDLVAHLLPGVTNVTEVQNSIQQEVFDYFKMGQFEFGQDFRTSQLVAHLHRTFSEIDYITHPTLDSLDKTAVSTQMISVDLTHKGMSVV